MRGPSPTIIQRDDMQCETMCTAQLLYMHNKLELSELSQLDRRIGRKPGEADLRAGNLRLLFEAGFHVVEIDPVDLRKAVADKDYVRQMWAEEFSKEVVDDVLMPQVYPQVRQRISHRFALIERYPNQYKRVPRKGTPDDLYSMVEKGWQVGCLRTSEFGTWHNILVVQAKGSKYQLFDPKPNRGLSELDRTIVADIMDFSYTGYYMP